MVGGQAAAAHAVEEDRDAERLGERAQLVLAARPVEAGAGHDHRALGPGEQLRRLLDAVGRLPADAAGGARHLGLGLHEDDVERDSRGRSGRVGSAERRVDRRARSPPGSRPVSLTVSADLVERRDERHVVDLLQRARAPAHLRRAAAEHDERRAVVAGAGDRAHPVGDAGAGGQRATPGSRVAFAQPSAAHAADCSWRTSTISIPSSLQPS